MAPNTAEPVETINTVKDFGKIDFEDHDYDEMW